MPSAMPPTVATQDAQLMTYNSLDYLTTSKIGASGSGAMPSTGAVSVASPPGYHYIL